MDCLTLNKHGEQLNRFSQRGKIYFLKVYDEIKYFSVLVGLPKLIIYRRFKSAYMYVMYAIFLIVVWENVTSVK